MEAKRGGVSNERGMPGLGVREMQSVGCLTGKRTWGVGPWGIAQATRGCLMTLFREEGHAAYMAPNALHR